jgi:hypothetical protein
MGEKHTVVARYLVLTVSRRVSIAADICQPKILNAASESWFYESNRKQDVKLLGTDSVL